MVKKVDTIFRRAPRFAVQEARMVVYNVKFQQRAGLGLGTISLLILLIFSSLFGSSFLNVKTAEAANTCTWTGAVNANWSNAGNWSGCGGVAPQAADTVSFTSGSVASTVDTVYTVAAVTVNGYTGTIILGASLTVNGNLTASSGAIDCGASPNYTLTVGGTGVATLSSGATIDNATIVAYDLRTNGATFNGTTSLTKNGASVDSWCSGGNTFNGATTITNGSGSGYWVVNSAGTDTYNSDVTFVNNSSLNSIWTAQTNSNTIFKANVTSVINGSASPTWLTWNSGTSTVTFSGAGTQQLSGPWFPGTAILNHNGTGTLQLNSAITIVTSLNNSAGILNLNGQGLTATGATFSNAGTIKLIGSETITGLVQDSAEGTWLYVGNGNGLADTYDIKNYTYYNLTINSADGATDTFRLPAANITVNGAFALTAGTFTTRDAGSVDRNLTVAGNLTIAGTFTANSSTITVGGNWDSSGGTFTYGTSTVVMTGVSKTIVTAASGHSWDIHFYNLTIGASGQSPQASVTAQTTSPVSGFQIGTSAGGSLTLWGTFTISNSPFNTVFLNTAATLTINTGGVLTGGGTFWRSLSNTSAPIANSGTISTGNFIYAPTSATTTVQITATTYGNMLIRENGATSIVVVGTGAGQTLTANNLTIQSATSGRTTTLDNTVNNANINCTNLIVGTSGNTSVYSAFKAGSGTISVSGNTTIYASDASGTNEIDAGASTWNVGGNWDSSGGTFNYGTSTVDLTGTGSLKTPGTIETPYFYNLSAAVTGKTTTLLSHIGAAHVLTLGTGTFLGPSYSATVTGAGTPFVNNGATLNLSYFFYAPASSGTLTVSGGNYGGLALYFAPQVSGATYQLGGALTLSGLIYFYNSSAMTSVFNTQNYGITANGLRFGSYNSFTVNLGSSTIDLGSWGLDVMAGAHTLNLDSASITTAGTNWQLLYGTGTITQNPGTSTVTFDGTSGTQTLTSNNQSFYNVMHTGAGTLQLATNGLSVGGTFTNSAGTFDANALTNTVTGLTTVSGGTYLASTNTQTLTGGLTVDGGTFSGSTGGVTTGTVTLSSGTLTAPSGSFNVTGNWTVSGGTFVPGTGTVTFSATAGTQNLNSGGLSFYNIRVPGNTSSATLLLTSNLHCTYQIWVSSGTFDENGYNVNSDVDMGLDGGTWYARTGTTTAGNFYVYSYYSTANFIAGSGTISVGDLSLYQYLGSGKVNGTFIAPSSTLTIGGNLMVSGTFTNNGGTVVFSTSATGKTLSGTMTGSNAFGNLTFTGGGSWTFSNPIDVAGTLAVTSGTVNTGNYALSVALDFSIGDSTHTGIVNAGTSSIILSGGNGGLWVQSASSSLNSTGTITCSASSGTQWLYSITGAMSLGSISHTGGSTLQPYSTSLSLSGTLTNSAGTFDANGSAHTFTGLATVSGGTYSASTATQTFNGGLTISGGTFTGSSGAVGVTGNLNISSGTFTAPSGNLTVTGNFTNNGTFTHNSGTVIFNGTSTLAGNAVAPAFAATFYNLTVNAGKTVNFTNGEYFKVIGAFNLSGTSGSHVTVNSSDNTNQWYINYQPGSASISYADVSNSGCDSVNSPVTANLNLDATSANVTNDGYCWFAPYLSFSMNSTAVNFNNLNNSNNYTDTQTTTFTTSTNAKHGYVVQGFMSDFLRALSAPTQTISDFPGTWSAPALWDNTCNIGGASYCGFGYTSSDTSVAGSDRFAGGTKYAAYSQTGPGDILADHGDIASEVKNEAFTITHKVSVPASQAAATYQATLTVIVTATY